MARDNKKNKMMKGHLVHAEEFKFYLEYLGTT